MSLYCVLFSWVIDTFLWNYRKWKPVAPIWNCLTDLGPCLLPEPGTLYVPVSYTAQGISISKHPSVCTRDRLLFWNACAANFVWCHQRLHYSAAGAWLQEHVIQGTYSWGWQVTARSQFAAACLRLPRQSVSVTSPKCLVATPLNPSETTKLAHWISSQSRVRGLHFPWGSSSWDAPT